MSQVLIKSIGAARGLDKDIIETCSNQRGNENPEQHVPDTPWISPMAGDITAGNKGPEKDRRHHCHTIPMECKRANLKDNRTDRWIHYYLTHFLFDIAEITQTAQYLWIVISVCLYIGKYKDAFMTHK